MSDPIAFAVQLDPQVIADVVGQVLRDELAAILGREPKMALSITEAAATLSINRSTAYRMARDGELPTADVGGRKVVPVVELERWLAARTRATANVRLAS